MPTKLIKVSDHVYRKLKEIKEAEGHTSFDSVLRELLRLREDRR